MRTRSFLSSLLFGFALIALIDPAPARAGTCGNPDNIGDCKIGTRPGNCTSRAACKTCCENWLSSVACARLCNKMINFEMEIDEGQATTCAAGSTAQGTGLASLDPNTLEFAWGIQFGTNSPAFDNGSLLGNETVAHFHGPAGPNSTAGIQVTITSGGSPNSGFTTIDPNQAAQVQAENWYVNIHSDVCTGGEIRGQVLVSASPAPVLPLAWLALAGAALAGAALWVGRRRLSA
jgi:hypothetical protein